MNVKSLTYNSSTLYMSNFYIKRNPSSLIPQFRGGKPSPFSPLSCSHRPGFWSSLRGWMVTLDEMLLPLPRGRVIPWFVNTGGSSLVSYFGFWTLLVTYRVRKLDIRGLRARNRSIMSPTI